MLNVIGGQGAIPFRARHFALSVIRPGLRRVRLWSETLNFENGIVTPRAEKMDGHIPCPNPKKGGFRMATSYIPSLSATTLEGEIYLYKQGHEIRRGGRRNKSQKGCPGDSTLDFEWVG